MMHLQRAGHMCEAVNVVVLSSFISSPDAAKVSALVQVADHDEDGDTTGSDNVQKI